MICASLETRSCSDLRFDLILFKISDYILSVSRFTVAFSHGVLWFCTRVVVKEKAVLKLTF